MVSDTERREVARRLRGAKYGRHSWERALYDALGVDTETAGSDMLDRLADLIEPSEPKVRCVAEVKVDGERLEKLAHDAVVKLTGVDRDALLKLAYLLQAMGEKSDEKGRYDLGITFTSIARRIREALGVQDA